MRSIQTCVFLFVLTEDTDPINNAWKPSINLIINSMEGEVAYSEWAEGLRNMKRHESGVRDKIPLRTKTQCRSTVLFFPSSCVQFFSSKPTKVSFACNDNLQLIHVCPNLHNEDCFHILETGSAKAWTVLFHSLLIRVICKKIRFWIKSLQIVFFFSN